MHGVVAIGGDLSVARILLAYRNGIFPWNNEEDPLTWWCPAQRMVLRPAEVKVSKSSRNLLNRQKFEIRADTAFEEVIENCQQIGRPGQQGTWLSDELKNSLIEVHKLGYAHSIEAFENNRLVGGLYGISIGTMFFGDSMFSRVSNASKIAFISLCKKLEELNFDWIDCQVRNEHLASLGAYEIPRTSFLKAIELNPVKATRQESWRGYFGG
ncbi:MAG: leucyl/phenylalanyl-tRNA--protein transferase [Owenweeksia sp.]|nr:leucyl/phenylalanyl-tRNA--protein transferase [Owenweeksia sp.]